MKIGPIIMCIFIFIIFAILLSFAVICVVEAIEKVAQKIRLIKIRRKYKNKRIENKINKLSPNQIRAILGFNPINHPKYKTAREMLENWPEDCPKPTNNEIRKYFGFPLVKEENDGN